MSGAHKIRATRRTLTKDETRALRIAFDAQFDAQRNAFRRAYQTSTGIERNRYLLAALAACGPLQPGIDPDYRVPSWLYEALCEQEKAYLQQVEPDIHWLRWLMVREGKRQKRRVLARGKWQEKEWTWPQARKYASEKLADTRWAGGVEAMKKSYDRVQRIRRLPG